MTFAFFIGQLNQGEAFQARSGFSASSRLKLIGETRRAAKDEEKTRRGKTIGREKKNMTRPSL